MTGPEAWAAAVAEAADLVVSSEQWGSLLRLATAFQAQLHKLTIRSDLAEAALDAFAIAIFILDPLGRLVHANRNGQLLLDRRDGLSVRERRLRCDLSDEHRMLHGAIRLAADTSPRGVATERRTIRISRPSRRRPFGAIVSPILAPAGNPAPFIYAAATGAAVLVTVSDPDDTDAPAPEHLQQLFELTPAESRLAAALAGGRSVAEYAEASRISVGTARWTLKRILAKTGCRRQAELVRLLAASAAGVVRARD